MSRALTTRAGRWILIDETSGPNFNDSPNKTSSTPTSVTVARHSKFFFDNILVAIQVENILFNVHKYQLEKSEVSSDMFMVPKAKGNEPEEGSSPDHPIVMEGIAASDFAALLTVLYAGQFSNDQPVPEAPLIIPAFRLANMFNFSELRAHLLALAEKNLGDVDKIVFAQEFGVKEWLAPAHTRLCKREAHLSTEEAKKLGVDSVLMISRMREKYQCRATTAIANGIYCSGCIGVTYYGHGAYACRHCSTKATAHYLRYDGPGKLGEKSNVKLNETTLDAEVTKWVEDGYATKG
ncbi:unnamed protein product [Rhizoctonia solani]|uniref:BTB domain-containing protein n=1 Tax=Rhizoctonia solani TaxID=456999 RepID=A0A8H3AH01_9AGAM|nr:unnamed protein product [Rhizoctonia solani]